MDSAFGASLVNVNCPLEKLKNSTDDLKIEQLVAAPGSGSEVVLHAEM
jgi:hypothetical protein